MIKEKIIKLLKSGNTDDQLLGVTLAVEVLGQEWCEKEFPNWEEPYNGDYHSEANIILDYGDFRMFIGDTYIEYLYIPDKIKRGFFNVKIINCKNDKELSKEREEIS